MNKAALKRMALEVRDEMGLSAHDRFDPLALAALYGVEVLCLSQLRCAPGVLSHLTIDKPELFSGALIPLSDGTTVIVENDAHNPERRMSTASHEMSHVVLEHPFLPTLTDHRGCRVSNAECEAEAAELSGELLMPFEACKRLAVYKTSDQAAADRFGVSIEFARWRLNATGARRIAARAQKKRRQ